MDEYYPEGYGCDADPDSVERLVHYEKGGLCPIILGQVLNNRYKIFAKLGFVHSLQYGWPGICLCSTTVHRTMLIHLADY